MFSRTQLGNETWPSFDNRDGHCRTTLIENLGHADFLPNQPFKHLNYLLCNVIVGLSAWARLHHPKHSIVSDLLQHPYLVRALTVSLFYCSYNRSIIPLNWHSCQGQSRPLFLLRGCRKRL
jgi:hypothetical protein